jgi:hypothetical protein
MPEGEYFRIGAEVRCASGEVCGEVRYLDISWRAHTLTHVAVEESGRLGLGRLVPGGQVRNDPHTGTIQFLGTIADFRKLDPSDVTTYVPGSPPWAAYPGQQVVEEPEYDPIPGEQVVGSSVPWKNAPTETSEVVPPGDVEIDRHYPVHAGSHEFGRVHGVLVDPRRRVTHVVLAEWHGLRHKEVAVPFGDQDTIDHEGFHLSMSQQEMEDLPPLGGDHPAG